jgi:hypothetical protein
MNGVDGEPGCIDGCNTICADNVDEICDAMFTERPVTPLGDELDSIADLCRGCDQDCANECAGMVFEQYPDPDNSLYTPEVAVANHPAAFVGGVPKLV